MSPDLPPRSFAKRRGPPVCRNCGSHHTRRSKPHNFLERVLRTATPIRFHVCAVCGARGFHVGQRAQPAPIPVAPSPVASNRPSSTRRPRLRRRRRERFLKTLLVAILLGTGAALMLQRCPTGGSSAESVQ